MISTVPKRVDEIKSDTVPTLPSRRPHGRNGSQPPNRSNGNGRHHPDRDSGEILGAPTRNGRHPKHDDLPDVDQDHVADGPVRQVEEWKVCDLKDHPRQGHFFPDESEEADRELAADMNQNGQLDPIDILPDGTILGGHRRAQAAKRLGWKTIRAVVHHDLADDAAGAEAFFINDNYTRRQLSELQKVRCAARRVELAKEGKVTLPTECHGLRKTRDKIGKLLGKSGREADRYLRVLKAPVEVQHACDGGHLSLTEAGKVAGLSDEEQEEIAEELREQGLDAAKTVVASHLPSKAATRRGAENIWFRLRRALAEANRELPGNVGNIGRRDREDLEVVEQAAQVLDEIRDHINECLEDEDDDEFSDTDELVHGDENTDVHGLEPVDIVSTERE